MTDLLLRRVSKSRAGAEDLRITTSRALMDWSWGAFLSSPVGTPWMWTVSYGFHEDHTPTHGYKPTREAAMAAFAKSWRRE